MGRLFLWSGGFDAWICCTVVHSLRQDPLLKMMRFVTEYHIWYHIFCANLRALRWWPNLSCHMYWCQCVTWWQCLLWVCLVEPHVCDSYLTAHSLCSLLCSHSCRHAIGWHSELLGFSGNSEWNEAAFQALTEGTWVGLHSAVLSCTAVVWECLSSRECPASQHGISLNPISETMPLLCLRTMLVISTIFHCYLNLTSSVLSSPWPNVYVQTKCTALFVYRWVTRVSRRIRHVVGMAHLCQRMKQVKGRTGTDRQRWTGEMRDSWRRCRVDLGPHNSISTIESEVCEWSEHSKKKKEKNTAAVDW